MHFDFITYLENSNIAVYGYLGKKLNIEYLQIVIILQLCY